MDFKDKVILVTGGANGIGAITALKFAQCGAKCIYLADMADADGEKMAQAIGEYCECKYMHTDVSNLQDVERIFADIEQTYGRMDVLFNCAGISSTKGLMETDEKMWDKIMAVNAKGVFFFSKKASELMLKNKYGKIINVSSIAGQVGGIRTSPAYAASKAAILALTKSFAKLGAMHNMTVNAISPGIVDTNMTRDKNFNYSTNEIPMGRAATPEEVASVVLFLGSDMSSYVTGQCINVNGGMLFN